MGNQTIDKSTELAILESIAIGSARGGQRPGQPLAMEYVRDLGQADLELVLNPPALLATTPAIKQIRHIHHMLARCLAEGHKQSEASLITGLSASRISILQDDPSFKELVTYYSQQVEARYLDVHARVGALGLSVVDELQDRLLDQPEGFSNGQLRELMETCLDRSFAPGPKAMGQGGLNISVNFVTPQNPEQGDGAKVVGEAKTIDITTDG